METLPLGCSKITDNAFGILPTVMCTPSHNAWVSRPAVQVQALFLRLTIDIPLGKIVVRRPKRVHLSFPWNIRAHAPEHVSLRIKRNHKNQQNQERGMCSSIYRTKFMKYRTRVRYFRDRSVFYLSGRYFSDHPSVIFTFGIFRDVRYFL